MADIFVNMNEAMSNTPPPPVVETVQPSFENKSTAEIPHRIDATTSSEKIAGAAARINGAREPQEPFAPTAEEVQLRIKTLTEQVSAGSGPVGAYIKALAKYGVVMERPVVVPEKKNDIDALKTEQYKLEQDGAKLVDGIFNPAIDGILKAKNILLVGAESALRQAKVSETAERDVPGKEAELQTALAGYVNALKAYVEPRKAASMKAKGADAIINAPRGLEQRPSTTRYHEVLDSGNYDATLDYIEALKKVTDASGNVPPELAALKADIDSGKRAGMLEKQLQPRYAAFLQALENGNQKMAA